MQSILAQTVNDWELIVCDSYSDDGTWEFLQQFKADQRVHLYQVPKEGLYAGWNECLKRAHGEHIYVATADDTMREECLEELMVPMLVDKTVGLVVSQVEQIDEVGSVMETPDRGIHLFLAKHRKGLRMRYSGPAMFLMLAGFGWGFGSATGYMFRRSILKDTGLFPTDLSYLGDAEWTLRAALATNVVWVDKTLATWRYHKGQASQPVSRLTESWHFREALRRVIDDPASGLPGEWRPVSRWREKLLLPRTIQLEMSTGLLRSSLRQHWRQFPEMLYKTWRTDPRLFGRRLLTLFREPPDWRVPAGDRVEEWLQTFHVAWPPVELSSERSLA